MKVAITGGSGFVGRHLARALLAQGHDVVLLARGVDRRDLDIREHPNVRWVAGDVTDAGALTDAFAGCEAIAHSAGINREIGAQTFRRVHIEGTANVLRVARTAGVRKIVLMSFLRARPHCGSAYHESKWEAEELVRNSGLDYTILKAGMVYGPGDHMLDHLGRSLQTLSLFATIGFRQPPIRPLAVEDLVNVLSAALVETRMPRQTVAVTGAEELSLKEAVRRVARVLGRRVLVFPAPLRVHFMLARVFERIMKIPVIARAQVSILAEGVVEAASPVSPLPADLQPERRFSEDGIRAGLPEAGAFGLGDLRCSSSS